MIIFIVGTGTDVGKTHVTAALGHAATGAGAWKPVATGMSDAMGDDARAIGAKTPPLYAFEPPISPHLAARRANITIRARDIAERAKELATGYEWFFVESAGGLFSPLSESETNFDLMEKLELLGGKTLLVAPDRIGVLHDVTATVRAAHGDNASRRLVLALSAPAVADASTGTNAEEIRRLRLAEDVVEFPRAAPEESADVARRVLEALGRATRRT